MSFNTSTALSKSRSTRAISCLPSDGCLPIDILPKRNSSTPNDRLKTPVMSLAMNTASRVSIGYTSVRVMNGDKAICIDSKLAVHTSASRGCCQVRTHS